MIDNKRLIATVNSMVHKLITVGHGWPEPPKPKKDDLAGDAPIVMLVSKQSNYETINKHHDQSDLD